MEAPEPLVRTIRAINARDFDAALTHYAPDAVWEHNIGVGSPHEGVYSGQAEIKGLWEAIAESFETFRFDEPPVEELRPGVLLARQRLEVSGLASGAQVTIDSVSIIELRDDLIVRQRFFSDPAVAVRAAEEISGG